MTSILYILVIYGSDAAEAEAMRTLFAGHDERLQHLFIYDNSPSPHTPPQGVAQYVHDPSNGGLGRAYNTACRYAEAEGYEWLLLLDQDTTFPPDAIDKYESAIATHPETDMIAPRHMVAGGKGNSIPSTAAISPLCSATKNLQCPRFCSRIIVAGS